MLKKLILITSALFITLSLSARINAYGESPMFTKSDSPEDWYDINPYTWEVFVSMDGDEMFGVNDARTTYIQTEFYSMGVIDGRQVGDFTVVASLTDRGHFFGGEGYMDLFYYAPVDANKYAQQIDFFGGWKYNLTKYVDIDIGGSIIYATKDILGPGLVIKGMGGEKMKGDIYIGFTSSHVYVAPFAYISYDPTYDQVKYTAGFAPRYDLSSITTIEGLSIEGQFTVGYLDAKRFSGSEISTGGYWRNAYAYLQVESNLVYQYKHLRTFIGLGWAIHNDGEYAPNGEYMGGNNNLWVGGGLGYVF